MRNLSVKVQLVFSFVVMVLFLVALGVLSYIQAERIHHQTETIYNHPLQVRNAIGKLNADILEMRLNTRNLMIAASDAEQKEAIANMDLAEKDAEMQFGVLKGRYLGDQVQVDSAYADFNAWRMARKENTRLALEGNIAQIKESISTVGKVGSLRESTMSHIANIDQFAYKKAQELYEQSNELSSTLTQQMIGVLLFMLVISGILFRVLYQNIRRPIQELASVTKRFGEGDMDARSALFLNNEFGKLSDSFNLMVEQIKENKDLSVMSQRLSDAMLIEDNSHRFFRELLPVLSRLTNSQMAAVYLLTDDKEYYEPYETVGMTESASRQLFPARGLHGDFGAALSSGRVEHVKNIPHDSRFVYQTFSGTITPREIITIPILAGGTVVAVISLASIRAYSTRANKLVIDAFEILTARVNGILTYREMRKFSQQLELQNTELETQKRELTSQSDELQLQNRELEIQKNQLEEASRLKTNFLSNMSHELRTPLNSVIALSGVLSRRLANKISADEYSYLDVIERNGKHLLSLINDILDISRIEAGREDLEITSFSVNELVTDMVTMIQPQAIVKNIQLTQLIYDPSISIGSDMHKCRHILQNLIGNAVKFTEKGQVEVGVVLHKSTVEISVTDTGIGISGDNMNHIFDEFRQADAGTSRKYGGAGLGLAIARKYALLLGGNVTVKSMPGSGSCFTLVLPLQYSKNNEYSAPVINNSTAVITPRSKRTTHDGEKTILLVDDSEPAIIQMKDFLHECGYKTISAKNGAEALEKLTASIPDAMILDLMMPGVDGFSVLETLRNEERTAHIPVLVLTSKHITGDDLKKLKINNVHQLIQKGDVNRIELIDAVDSMIVRSEIETAQPIEPVLLSSIGKEKPTVLIVEDNPDNMITVKALIGTRFNILEAIDGDEGVAVARQRMPELVLMDIALPGIDGIRAFKKIRQTGGLSHVPVIAVTASAMTSDREKILAYGFDAYIPKPIDNVEFFRTIDNVLYGK